VSNLVENAIKYTPSGRTVSIDLSREGHQGKLKVTDTGIGIPPESQLNIFDRFYRAPNARTLEAVGTGLGLTLVKRLVDSYHGTIMFTSEKSSGTTFTIMLPLKRVLQSADGTEEA
jgi:signal transduction histidine kinase